MLDKNQIQYYLEKMITIFYLKGLTTERWASTVELEEITGYFITQYNFAAQQDQCLGYNGEF